MPPRSPSPPRGVILDPGRAARRLDLRMVEPAEAMRPWVHHHWFLSWDVPEPFTQSLLGQPRGNLTFEGGGLMLSGPYRRRFDHRVEGRATVHGTQFLPAALPAFTDRPLQDFLDRRVDVASHWGVDAPTIHAQLDDLTDTDRVQLLTGLLRARAPEPSPEMDRANEIVALLATRRELTRTEQVAEAVGSSPRSLQRLLAAWVGMSPKQLIRRFRLQEAAARLAEGAEEDLADLAYALGYADQAHFSRDFKGIVGVPPSHYAQRQATTTERG